jgi:ribosomal protein S18 acetylase RimI-like enzyme
MTDWEAARRLLEGDRVWSAYALADLDPQLRDLSDVWIDEDSLLLRFRGFRPAVLFAYGAPARIRTLLASLQPSRYIFTFDLRARRALEGLLRVDHEVEMHRMVYQGAGGIPRPSEQATRLSSADLGAINELMDDHQDRPDAFHPSQVELGSFFGIWRDGRLCSMAGTHVLSPAMGVAAIGNVFTHPECRGQGYGRSASAAVLDDLITRGIETAVLNTQIENVAAIRLYRGLGFESYCRYMEGIAFVPA